MEFTGTAIWKGEERSGQGQNGTWRSLEFALEDKSGQYAKKACFEAGTKAVDYADKIKVGDNVTVSYDIDANEYKGRFYNKLKAFKIVINSSGGAAAGEPKDSFGSSPSDDLPF